MYNQEIVRLTAYLYSGKAIIMLLANLLWFLAVASYGSEADFTEQTIREQFNIGQLFAFYNMDNLCKTWSQVAVAKKDDSKACQWKISADFSTPNVERRRKEDGDGKSDKMIPPIEDYNGNCLFSCVFGGDVKYWHTEKVINRYLVAEGANREEYNLQTFKAPCEACELGTQERGGRGEKAELEQYLTVYYTKGNGFGRKIQSDALSKAGSEPGLAAIKYKTRVNLNAVKTKVIEGRKYGKTEAEILEGIRDIYLQNAVESYLKQHPE